jgi:hypothetical protein
MSKDELLKTRIGFVADGDPDTELMAALYEHDETGVRLKIPYAIWADDVRGRWWSQGATYVDDPDRTKYKYSPPSELDYYDSKGAVGFIGCRSGAASRRFGGYAPDAGVGVVNARYAVEGAVVASNYVNVNGFRSEIEGLGQWLGYSALKSFMTFPKNGSSNQITTTAEAPADMKLSRRLNLKAVAHAHTTPLQSPEITYTSRVFLETFTKSAKAWEDHLTLHFALRDLVRVASWQPVAFRSHQAASLKETISIDSEEKQTWREVRTVLTRIAESTWRTGDRFLFIFDDFSTQGVTKWLDLTKTYTRGIDPFLRLLDLEGATVDAHVMQLGIAVEAIGYQALIDSGTAANRANNIRVKERVDHLLTEVAGAISFTSATFSQDFADAYNSVKHANRAPVALAEKVDLYRQGVEMIRAWVAIRLGVSPAVVKSRLQ